MDEELAFVVAGPASEEVLSETRGAERRRAPFPQWINWLHVIVPIEHQCWLPRREEPVGIHAGMSTVGTGQDLYMVQALFCAMLLRPARGRFHVGSPLRLG